MNVLFEAKYALRLLRKSPGYTITSVLVTSVGITISLVAFTIIYTMAYKPLTYADSENWYSMMFSQGGLFRNTDDYFYQRLAEQDFQNFKILGRQYAGTSVISDGELSRRVSAGYKSPALFNASTVKPLLGRLFQSADSEIDSPPTVLLSYEAWQVYYQADPNVVGRTSRIEDRTHTIIGVLPQGFNLGAAHDIWLPHKTLRLTEPMPYGRGSPIIILKSKFQIEAANAEINQFFRQLKAEFPDVYGKDTGVLLNKANSLPGAESLFGMMALVAGIFVLFSCLNTGSLLFTNALRRQQEFVVRNAMGSSAWQLLKQSLFESFCICVLATLIGALLGQLALSQIAQLTSSMFSSGGVNASHHYILSLGLPSILFLVTTMLVMWLLSGFVPVWRAVRLLPKAGLANHGKGVTTGSSRAASMLAAFQIVFSSFLLIVSGILVSAMNYASQRDLGIDTKQVLTANVLLSERFEHSEDKLRYLDNLESEALALQDIEAVGFASSLPSLEMVHTPYRLEDRGVRRSHEGPADPVVFVSDGYFNTLGIELLAGRSFDSADNHQSMPVVIVDERLAQRYWPGESAIGKRIQLGPENNSEWLTIVGVTSHVLGSIRFQADTEFLIYRPIYQSMPRDLRLVVKYSGDFSAVLPQVNRAATLADRELPLSRVEILADYYLGQNAMSFMVMFSRMFMYIAAITGLLAVIGIFAVFSRNVIRGRRETGIRRSLGASRENILWLHLKKGIFFSVAGCGLGLFLALLALGAVFSTDGPISGESIPLPFIVGGVPLTLALCVLLASYLPARKSVLDEPGDALRYE